METEHISTQLPQEVVREQAVLWHLARIGDRNPPILTAIEERWDELNAAFGLTRHLHRKAHEFGELYEQMCELSSEQVELASVETFAEAQVNLERLAAITEQVDDLIARLFSLLAAIEAEALRWLVKHGV